MLGRAPDTAGLNYWLGSLGSGSVTKDTFLLAIINGARSGGPADAQFLLNKEAVGAHFALTHGLGNNAWAHTVMAGVNGTAASITTANALTDGFAATAATAGSSELVIQLVGIVA